MLRPANEFERHRVPPERWQGIPCWSFAQGAFRARFLGIGAPGRDAALAGRLAPEVAAAAWLHQCHSAAVLDAEPGLVGDGDALVVRRTGLAAIVATADCVPVLVAGERSATAIHAGWRGIVAGVVGRALERLAEPPRAAWVGPAIGPCCYEVGPEVAAAVVGASDVRALAVARGERPYLDLQRAVAAQLARCGVEAITVVDLCTRCHPELLASHRRDGERAGRNLALVWRVA